MKFFKNIIDRFAGKPVDWDELEESLIRSDIGVPMTLRITQRLQERDAHSRITANDISEVAREQIGRVLPINPVHPRQFLSYAGEKNSRSARAVASGSSSAR